MRYRNFLSTGNVWIKIDFTKAPSSLVVGKNGSGKSTMLDALTFVLFGKPYRNINKPTLINTSNGKGLEVEIEFDAGPNSYKIHRGIKPNVFEIFCNGKLVDQTAASRDYQLILEESILRMNYKTFTQVVILGTASFVPFMQLKASDRRIVTETVIGVQILSIMAIIAKQKLNALKDEDIKLKNELDKLEAMRSVLETNLKEAKSDINNRIIEWREDIRNHEDKKKQFEIEVDQLETEQTSIQTMRQDEPKVKSRKEQLVALDGQIITKKKTIEDQIVFFHNHETCPVCQQSIAEQHRAEMIIEREPKLDKLEKGHKNLLSELEKANDQLKQFADMFTTMSDNQSKLIRLRTNIRGIDEFIAKREKEIADLQSNANSVAQTEQRLQEIILEILGIKDKRTELLENIRKYEISLDILKDDGYKAQVIKKYLPLINQSINKYLQAMNFYATFELNEEFKETIKSRYIDDFAYENFSEGEKQRIDMALLFSWRAIAKIKGSIDTNLLIMDEIFDSSLDGTGIDDLLGIFNTFGEDTNLYVISHRGDQLLDKFKSVLRFTKVKGFTQMTED